MGLYMLHSGEAYWAERQGPGVLITHRVSGVQVWLQGDEADDFELMMDGNFTRYTRDDACAEYFGRD